MARLRALASLALVAALLACASGPAPRDHFYRLQVPPPARAAATPTLPGTLEIDRPRADDVLRERAILRSDGVAASEVIPYVYHLWVDSPTLMVQRELASWLRAAGVANEVVLPEAGTSGRWLVNGRLERFDHVVTEDKVHVALELRLKDMREGKLVFQRHYTADAPTGGGGVSAAAPAFGTALGAIFERFAADVAATRS